ncbi:MAG: DTW domain-containing protein [Verrucomicrobiales bacterium]|nr:DTW domain-containing protein [Verrucomicrobiales bacterium]
MNLEKYRMQRAELEQSGRETCWECRRPQVGCLCEWIRPFDTRAHFVILIHPKEAEKQKCGTGRLASECLNQSSLIKGIDFTEHEKINAMIDDPSCVPMLVYPGEDAFNISETPLETMPLPSDKTLLLFVVDGTWACAKKMMRLSKNLQKLPRLCFTPEQRSEFSIKHQPHEFCLSTIESIHLLLEEMERTGIESLNGAHHNLLEVFRRMIDFQIACAADPKRPGYRRKLEFKPAENRKPATRYSKRRLFYR